jgi:DNA helicase-2/ATP-dependent DNA helicase PcrA
MSKVTPQLTPQQQQVIQHAAGPALVFAVAGAGKTTAMVHRIERLVRENVTRPERILATSFGKKNQQDLVKSLAKWPYCRKVEIRTLHSLGLQIIRQAQSMRLGPAYKLDEEQGYGDSAEQRLLTQAMAITRQRKLSFARELEGLDRQDFLDYVTYCKGNFYYANLDKIRLPAVYQPLVGRAPSPSLTLSWYPELYELFEEVRHEQRVITFPDMLLTSWELLVTQPDLLTAMQQKYDQVLVDEFQDVNLVQSELLDLLTASHRNYMAIGDDDQTIYEWRGASPRFILNFAKRYQAQLYTINENFRCPAAPLVLANQVIAQNKQRHKKQLHLTQGFLGLTALYFTEDLPEMAGKMVREIQTAQQAGLSLDDIAILVRVNAQTPYIEQALIETQLPYVVSKPFYDRPEIQTLVHYCRLAWLDKQLRDGKPLTAQLTEMFQEAWGEVHNKPLRYFSRNVRQQVQDGVTRGGVPLSQVLQSVAQYADHEGTGRRLRELADIIFWLSQQLEQPAYTMLQQLDLRLDYRHYLVEHSGFPQTGEGRAASVAAFIEYAQGKGSLWEFLQFVRQLARQRIGRAENKEQPAVTLTTIHQAKGLEWKHVIVAQCNQGMMPFVGEDGDVENLEEERRLFYVALTRTKTHLSLYALRGEPLSQFLLESQVNQTLPLLEKVQKFLRHIPAAWPEPDTQALAMACQRYQLHSYFHHWHNPAGQRPVIAEQMVQFLSEVKSKKQWSKLGLQEQQLKLWQSYLQQNGAGQPTAD